MRKALDLTGQRFGRLVAVERVGSDARRNVLWRCECDCGNKNFVVAAHSLARKRIPTQSCGCILKERREASEENFAGREFGRLLVVSCVGVNKHRQSIWRCECDCGNKNYIASRSHLLNGAQSCGCRRAEQASALGAQHIKRAQVVLDQARVDGTSALNLIAAAPSNNTSGIKGVCFDKANNRWRATIAFKGKRYFLGAYRDIAEAAAARKEAEKRIFGPFLDWFEENIRPLPKRTRAAQK